MLPLRAGRTVGRDGQEPAGSLNANMDVPVQNLGRSNEVLFHFYGL